MARALLHIPKDVYCQVQAHLLCTDSYSEEAGFVFARHVSRHDDIVFEFVEWRPVPPEGFVDRSYGHLELTDETRASLIKRAHDLDACIVEFHAHTGPWPAAFSASDLLGFREFVPHVWWRLRGKPYVAVVVTRKDFDALAWLTDPQTPQHLDGIEVEGSLRKPTGLSPLTYDVDER